MINYRTCLPALAASIVYGILCFPVGASTLSQTGQLERPKAVHQMEITAWTDNTQYSRREGRLRLNASLQNPTDTPIFIDRRMYWTGLGGGLKVEINDAAGNPIPAHFMTDAIMPPPDERDTTILVRLDKGFFYGTHINLIVKDFFPRPGKYSIRVTYKSRLRQDTVAPELRNLPVIWADEPAVTSAPVWIQVTE